MKRFVCLIATVALALSLSACAGVEEINTAKSDELKAQYSFYEKSVKVICDKMDVTPEQADEIFLVLVNDCGLDGAIRSIYTTNGGASFSYYWEGSAKTQEITLENGVVSEVRYLSTVLYPAESSDSTDSADNSSDTTETQEPDSTTEATIENAVDSAIEAAHAEKERVTINDDLGTGSGKIVLIYLKAHDNLTNNMIKTGMLTEARDIMQALQPREDVSEITMFWSFPLIDAYGNTEDGTIYKININKSTLDKINFERFDYKSIPDIANDFFEHPALQD